MKRLKSGILALALILSMAVPARAAAAADSLEEAVLAVRAVVDIPDSMTEFSYYSYEYNYDGETVSCWYLNWYNEGYTESMSAEVDSLGNLNSYYRYAYASSEESGLAKVTREQGAKAAEAFIDKALPGLAADMRQVDEESNKMYTYRLAYTYQLYKNDIPVPFVQVQVYIDKYTGEVSDYYGLSAGMTIPNTFETGAVISADEAKAAYLEGIGISLKYYSSYDYDTKTLTVFPAYAAGSTSSRVIDAETGGVAELYSASYIYSYMSGSGNVAYSMAGESADRDSGLSAAEREAVDTVAGLISSEEAAAILKNRVEGISEDMSAYNVSLNKNYIESGKYTWSLSFRNDRGAEAYGSVDAKTGEILSFSIYDEELLRGDKGLALEDAREIAEEFLASEAADKLAVSKFSDSDSYTAETYGTGEAGSYNLTYYRQANGIDFEGNGLNVTVNANSGMITGYSCTWYDNVSFPSIDSIISTEAAFDVFNTAGNLHLAYGLTDKNTPSLIYQFENSIGFYVDPLTGERINRSGGAYTETGSLPEYTDIAGHWSEAIVKELVFNGYYLPGSEFRPDEAVTQYDFLMYLYPIYSQTDVDSFYSYLERRGIVTAAEKDPQAELSRQDASKFMIQYLGLGLAAEHSEIFINPFPDTVNEAYLGCAALCKALGVMQGGSSGEFNGTGIMTRAEAAAAIHRLLQVG